MRKKRLNAYKVTKSLTEKILCLNTDKVQDLYESLLYSATAYRWHLIWDIIQAYRFSTILSG